MTTTNITNTIPTPEKRMIGKILEFYENKLNWQIFTEIVRERNYISLRLFDYFTTNYCKENRVLINGADVWADYKACLRGYTKLHFDPFCRRGRIFLKRDPKTQKLTCDFIEKDITKDEINKRLEQGEIETTVGQLNFFMWCIQRGIITYILRHQNEIQTAMTSFTSQKKQNKNNNNKKTIKDVVRKGSSRDNRKVYTTHMKITLQFK
jgi:hypothetical protein